jgi:hypothetical protein
MGDQTDPICYRFARAVGRFFRRRTPIDYFTAVLAGSTAVQVYAFVQSERSFLAISGMAPVSGLTTMSDRPLEFSLEIKNGGRSTAFIEYMISNVTISFDELPDLPHYDYSGRSSIRGPVVPGGIYPAVFSPKKGGTPFVPTDSQISAINIGSLKLYVFGYIQYRDDFSHFGYKETGYCYLFNPRGDPTKSMFSECGKEHYVYAK